MCCADGFPVTVDKLMRLSAVFALLSTLFHGPSNIGAADSVSGPQTPEAAAEEFALHPDCRIELVAAEPDVIDPVHMEFAPDGSLWVVEMSDYPNGPDPTQPGRSRIRVLRDPDGDGRYSDPVLFADGLLFANGLMHWRDGVIVTANGQILFLQDTTGDGRADARQVWFTGFATENPQLRCNHPTLGPDNTIVVANGLRGGNVVPGESNPWGLDPQAPGLSISGMDFQFDPFTGAYEALSGVGQFGLTFDDWGNRFECTNRNPCKQIIIADADLKRTPWLRLARVYHDVSPAAEQSRLFPLSRTWTTSNLHANQFTAACGVVIYRGDALGDSFYGDSFTCDPTANLVHRDILTPQGVTFRSRPGRNEVEFLATKDEWFRPVNLTHGPDGALYVVDMYRAVIEHPQFMPEELKTRPDLLLGTDRGRIWRVVSRSQPQQGRGPRENLSDESPNALAERLTHPNVWSRETAKRLLVEADEPIAVPMLRQLIADPTSGWGAASALAILDRFGELSIEDVEHAAKNPQALRAAIRWGTRRFAEDRRFHQLAARELERSIDAAVASHQHPEDQTVDAGVLSTILSSVSWETFSADRHEQVVRFLWTYGAEDEWLQAALIIHAGDQLLELCKLALDIASHEKQTTSSPVQRILSRFAESLGRRNQDDEARAFLLQVLAPGTPEDAALASIVGLADGLPGRRNRFHQILRGLPQKLRDQSAVRAEQVAARLQAGDQWTAVHLRFLGYADDPISLEFLTRALAAPETPDSAQLVDVLAMRPEELVDDALVSALPRSTPRRRRQILVALTANPRRMQRLLDEVETGRVAAIEIDDSLTRSFSRQSDRDLVARAERLLKQAPPADRLQVLSDYQRALSLNSEPIRGRLIFEKNCATCHRVGGVGVDVAPDISDSRTKTREFLLTNILDPNRAIDSNYFSFTVVDVDGRVHTGIIQTETSTSITLKQAEAKTVTISRDEIDEIKNNGISLMPIGLEKTIDQQQMADLISFIKNWRYLDGQVPEAVIR